MDKILLISPSETIKDALRKLNGNGQKILFVTNEEEVLLGVLTDGDLRRIILDGKGLSEPITGLFNTRPIQLRENEATLEHAQGILIERKITALPVVDEQGRLVDFYSWDRVFSHDERSPRRNEQIDLPVVIMAGGKGTRLAPFTTVLPKPLIPIGEKTILELIIDQFRGFGVEQFFLTLNYRGEMIRAYLDGIKKDYRVSYVREDDYWGTAGSLSLLRGNISDRFFVSNCDIIVRANYADVLAFHKSQKAMLTVISSYQHHVVPYGVVDFKNGGEVVGITEKPEFTFPINTGVYLLEREALEQIPGRTVFHMTHLIDALISRGKKVITYPVNESDYIDIGQWSEYQKVVDRLDHTI